MWWRNQILVDCYIQKNMELPEIAYNIGTKKKKKQLKSE